MWCHVFSYFENRLTRHLRSQNYELLKVVISKSLNTINGTDMYHTTLYSWRLYLPIVGIESIYTCSTFTSKALFWYSISEHNEWCNILYSFDLGYFCNTNEQSWLRYISDMSCSVRSYWSNQTTANSLFEYLHLSRYHKINFAMAILP